MPVTALEAFDLETKSWSRYPCIPTRRAFSCCATNGQSLFSIGGLQQPGPHNFYSRPHFVSTMEEYDLDQGMLLFRTLYHTHTHTHKVIQICIHSYEHTLFWLSSGLLVRGSELWALNSVLGSELWVLTQGSKL